jgi:uncharacterized damage-inducible protein DinB
MLAATAARAADPPTVAKLYDAPIASIEHDLVPLVEAMPADKFSFAPTNGEFKGVRTFAEQVKHVAKDIYVVSAAALGEKPPVDIGSSLNGPESVKSKEQIVQSLKGAFAYGHKAAQSLTAASQLELVKSPWGEGQIPRGFLISVIASHANDHYGQLVVYARMNGIVPPSSR